MQRTAVLYGVAASTLLAAFLLAPRERPPAPVPPPPVPPPAPASPVVDLAWSDGALQVRARLDRGALQPGSGEPVWMDVSVTAIGVEHRAPLTTILVMDRSGSMAGDKIEAARLAGQRFVAALRDGDQLGIVSFGTDVTVDFPIATMDAATRAQAARVVARTEEGGGTNISGGLQAAKSLLARADLAGRTARIVFVSDGRPTEGERRTSQLVQLADGIRQGGVTMSTLGLGLDYNEDLMEALAVEGGGRYHYLRGGAELAAILDAELKHATSIAAADVKLHLPTTFGPFKVGAAPGADLSFGTRATIDVGDLAAGEERRLLVRLDVEPTWAHGHAVEARFAAPEITYKRPTATAPTMLANRGDHFRMLATQDASTVDGSRVGDVRARVLQVEASLALTESMRQYAEGDVAGARRKLEAKKTALEAFAAATGDASAARGAMDLGEAMDKVQAAAPTSAAGMDYVKSTKAKAFELRR